MVATRKVSNNRFGRPRSNVVTAELHAAVLSILERRSFSNLSMESIASRAGVSRPALYRRYVSVGEVTLDALEARGPILLPLKYSADIRKDLRSYFRALIGVLSEKSAIGRAIRGTLTEALMDTKFSLRFSRFIDVRRQPVIDRLHAWNGTISPVQLELLADRLFGPILYRLLIRQVAVSESVIRNVVDSALANSDQPHN